MSERHRVRGTDDGRAIHEALGSVDAHDALQVLVALRRTEGFIQGIDTEDDYRGGYWLEVDDQNDDAYDEDDDEDEDDDDGA